MLRWPSAPEVNSGASRFRPRPLRSAPRSGCSDRRAQAGECDIASRRLHGSSFDSLERPCGQRPRCPRSTRIPRDSGPARLGAPRPMLPMGEGTLAARDAAGDPISGVFVTVKICHRQGIRRFLTAQRGARNALSYTKRLCVRASEHSVAKTHGRKGLVTIGGLRRAGSARSAERDAGTWLAPRPNQQIDFGTINGPRH